MEIRIIEDDYKTLIYYETEIIYENDRRSYTHNEFEKAIVNLLKNYYSLSKEDTDKIIEISKNY